MQRTSLAPVLSATRHRVSCWIIRPLLYFARSMTSTTRQRFDLESGRVSTIRTVSPRCASPASSCALSLVERRTILPYSGWRTCEEMRTTTVFSIASETTRPVRTFLLPRSPSATLLRLLIGDGFRAGRRFLLDDVLLGEVRERGSLQLAALDRLPPLFQ